jgi:hypothetical protein
MVVMVSVGISQPGAGQIKAFERASLSTAMNSALNIVLAYSGHITYFGFAAELRDPRDFTKSLILMQTTAVTLYAVTAVVIYYYVGHGVPAPALGAASQVMAKVAYGIASLTIVIAGVINGHIASKYIWIRMWSATKSGAKVIQERSVRSWASWIGICSGVWVVCWIIAEAVPSFKYLLALVSAMFSGWFSCE